MTVQTNTNVARFNGNGVTQIFPIAFKFNSAADLAVLLVDDATGAPSLLALNSDYTVSGEGDEGGGLVNVVVAPGAGKRLFVSRTVDILQMADLRNQGKFFAETHEDALDLLTMIAQQLKSDIDRSLRVAETDVEPARIPPAAQRAGKLFAFDEDGNPTTALPVEDSSTMLRQELSGEFGAEMVGFGEGTVSEALNDVFNIARQPSATSASPLLVEQHVTGFFGRGMLAAEPTNNVGEQGFSGTASIGATTVPVADTAPFKVGGSLVIRYQSGKYMPHFIHSVSADSIGIRPGLYESVTPSEKLARTWFDTSHPGRFYTRYLAQRVASVTGLEGNTPTSQRRFFSQFDSNPLGENDTLSPIGGASISYFDETNDGDGGEISNPIARIVGRTALVDISAVGDGAATIPFDLPGSLNLHCRALLKSLHQVKIEIVDISGHRIAIGSAEGSWEAKYRDFLFRVKGNSGPYHVEITSSTPGSRIWIDQLEVFDAGRANRIIDVESSPKIVVLGDSWVAGFIEGSIQREPLTTQLAAELPNATIINAGVGGNAVQDLLARFDVDVAPHKPDYVVINTGTNDAANPSSETFFPTAVDFFQKTYAELLGKIQNIGARPIIIGLPALAETQGLSVNWEQNNRARTYSRYLYKNIAQNPVKQDGPLTVVEESGNADTGYVKYSDGRLEFWVTTTVSMATASDQTINPPAGANPVGRVRLTASLITVNSGNTLAAWSSHTLRGSDSEVLLNITSVGASASESIIVNGVGRWK